jgi:hypothetical protein
MSRRLNAVYPLAFAASVLLFGCSLLVPFDDRTAEPSGTEAGRPQGQDGASQGDSETQDAGTTTDASAPCPLPNLLANSGFESALVRWDKSSSPSAAVNATAHSGATSVRICGTSQASESLSQDPTPALAPARYYARMWARLPAGPSAATSVSAYMSETFFDEQPAADWLCLDGMRDTTRVRQFSIDVGEGCALIDDVALYAVPDGGVPPECRCQP